MADEPEEIIETRAPMAAIGDRKFTRLQQVTISDDNQIESVNQLLSDGWQVLAVGFRPEATVYVLGRMDEKRKHRAGFLADN